MCFLIMCDNKSDELYYALLARREKLMNMKKTIIERSAEKKINSSDDFIENSDTEVEIPLIRGSSNKANNIINCSTDNINTENDFIKTSTISLPLSHSFFNKPEERFVNTTTKYNNQSRETSTAVSSFSYISDAINIIQNEELNVVTETNPFNTQGFDGSDIVLHNSEIRHSEECHNTQKLSPLYVIIETDASNSNKIAISDKQQKIIHLNEEENIQDLAPQNVDMDTDATNVDIFAIPNMQLELNHTIEDENIHISYDQKRTSLNLNSCKEDVPENIIAPQEENEGPEISSPSILTNETELDQQNKITLLETPSTSSHLLNPIICNKRDARRNKNQHVTSKFVKSCMDFYLDDEKNDFSSGSSDLWSEKEEFSDGSEEEKKKQVKSKNTEKISPKEIVPLKKRKTENKRKTRKNLKESGLAYETLSGKVKEARKIHENPCKENKCTNKCFEVSEERRKSIFNYFWALNDEKKHDFLVQCCRLTEIKRKKTQNTISRRSVSYEYFINEGEGRRRVCQQFILKTLGISQTYLLYSVRHAKEGLSTPDSRTRTAPDKYDENTKSNAKTYIESLPALASHYSRKKSNKLYLPEQFKNLSNLYRLYVKHCQESLENYLSEKIFSNIFKEYNFAFHVPKKDKCSICTKNENNPDTTTTEQLQTHLLEKEATYKRFNIHQNLQPDQTLIVASFDLQKVLATPHGESMMLYYSRKYAVYNFTVYECRTQNGYCYTWGESDGKRGSCEIATCLMRYLKNVDSRGVKTLIFYCDNCTGQNKNRVILSMLKHFLQQSINLQTIQINYLLPGHTYMPVDSTHAIIEREIKQLILWAPSQWPTFMEAARKRPKPYSVEVLEHTDFLNFNIISDTVFTPAVLKNKDLRIKQIKVCTFKKTDLTKIHVKYTMLENGTTYVIETELQEKGKGKGIGKKTVKGKPKNSLNKTSDNTDTLPSLYKERLPISVAKYTDLKKLCEAGIIPKRFHSEYLNLPNKMKVIDTLNNTDEEDSEDIMVNRDD